MEQNKRLEIYDFMMHKIRFYWIIKRKSKIHVLIPGGESSDFQPCFRGGSVIFVPKGGGGPYIFFINHISKCSVPPLILFYQSLIVL